MRKIGKSWTKKTRTINGKKRLVKVRKIGKKYQVRKLGYRNRTDKTKSRSGRLR